MMGKLQDTFSLGPVLRKIAVAGVFTVAVVLLLFWLAGSFHEKIDADAGRRLAGSSFSAGHVLPPDARLEPVRLIRVPSSESAVGTIRAVHETSLASKILAKVTEVNVTAGQKVSAGDVLVRLDDADLKARRSQAQAAVDNAKAAFEQAKIEYERIDRLHKEGSASQIEYDRASTQLKTTQAALEQAEHARDEAQTILDEATIRSSIDGVVVDKQVEAGDMAQPGQTLLTLYDPTRMQLVASVRESLTQHLAVDQTIDVQVDALGKTCQGRISEIVPEAEAASRSFSVKVTGPCPPGIYTGMFGRLKIPLGQQQVLVVPIASVRRIGQLEGVDVADGGRARRRAIQTGRTYGDSIEVLSGLREGEMVVLPSSPPEKGDRSVAAGDAGRVSNQRGGDHVI